MTGELFILSNAAYIDNFKSYLTQERHASKNTISAYICDITKFGEFLCASGKDNFADVTEHEIRHFASQLASNGRSPATVVRCIASLKAFYSRLTSAGLIESNPAIGVSTASVPKKAPRILSGDEIVSLLEQPDTNDAKGRRDKAMLETLYATGIRVSELIALDVSDVNLNTGLITCHSGRVRTIPIYEAAARAIMDYFEFSRPLLAISGENALFVNTTGARMSRQGFWKLLKCYTEKAQISDGITPQMLRKSFAAHLLENGADVRLLKELLGHADISSTQVYARAVKKQLKDSYNKAHPRA